MEPRQDVCFRRGLTSPAGLPEAADAGPSFPLELADLPVQAWGKQWPFLCGPRHPGPRGWHKVQRADPQLVWEVLADGVAGGMGEETWRDRGEAGSEGGVQEEQMGVQVGTGAGPQAYVWSGQDG